MELAIWLFLSSKTKYMPLKKHSETKSVSSPKKQSKHLRRYYIDYGSFITFPQQLAYKEFPAGLYYPETDRSDNFMMRRIDPLKRQAMMEMYGNNPQSEEESVYDEDEIEGISKADLHQLSQILEEEDDDIEDSPTTRYAGALQNVQRLEKGAYLSEGYFPLERYNPGLMKAEQAIREFLDNKDFFVKNNLGYRRSILLFGEPGTGKSRYIDQTCKRLIEQENAVVIRLDSRRHLDTVADHGIIPLEVHLADQLKVFVIEELAEVTARNNLNNVLNFMDNAVLRNNVVFLMTTNTPERIPRNLTNRPSRVDVLEEVNAKNMAGFPEAWYKHITGKELPREEQGQEWYHANLTPAYMKELFLLSQLKDISPTEAYKGLEHRIRLISKNFAEEGKLGFF